MTLLKHEIKSNLKALLIWAGCVGFGCLGCLLLFDGIRDAMEPMAEVYGEMGAFSAALGLDKLNVADIEGYFATEIAVIFAVGGAMFAAMTGAAALSKEEEGHTAEFLYTLPVDRLFVVLWKYAAMVVLIVLFQIICILCILAGFAGVGEMPDAGRLVLFFGTQLLMQLEVGSVCFFISSLSGKKQIGAAVGLSVLLYAADVMCRVVPDLEALKYITPFYFSNAADIFVNGRVERGPALTGMLVLVISGCLAAVISQKRDFSA